MKTRILTLVLIATAIVFSSCTNDQRTYTFGETTIFFDPDLGFPDLSGWYLKEISPSGRIIKYYLEDWTFPGNFEKYKISPKIKNEFNSSVYPDSLEFELMKKRAEMWIRKIDSVNKEEIQSEFQEIFNN